MKKILAFVFLFVVVSGVWAQGSPCERIDPYDMEKSTEELQEVADKCTRKEFKVLYQNRAYAQTLLLEFDWRSKIEIHSRGVEKENGRSVFYYFISFAEVFAEREWHLKKSEGKDALVVVLWLNKSYDKAIEVAELHLKGRDNMAQQMERMNW